jgi:hypothetical protein
MSIPLASSINKSVSRTPVVLLRTAAVLMLLHFVGHTLGMMRGSSHGPEEVAVIETMKAHRFDMMGSMRSYWDFFLGFGYAASISMFLQMVLFWFLARLAGTHPASARPFIAVFLIAWAAEVLLCLKYFFIAPTVFAVIMVAVLAAAWLTMRPRA